MSNIRKPGFAMSDRRWNERNPEQCRHDLTAHVGRLAVVVEPGATPGKDMIRREIASTLAGRFAHFGVVQFSAHQSCRSLVDQFALEARHGQAFKIPTAQDAAELLQTEFVASINGTAPKASAVNGIYLPSANALLPEGLYLATQYLTAEPNAAHVAVVSREDLCSANLPAESNYGDTYVVSAQSLVGELSWVQAYQSPLTTR